jgi:hypothetical protein
LLDLELLDTPTHLGTQAPIIQEAHRFLIGGSAPRKAGSSPGSCKTSSFFYSLRLTEPARCKTFPALQEFTISWGLGSTTLTRKPKVGTHCKVGLLDGGGQRRL